MKISKIEIQKKNKNRCSIYIDGEFKFGLTKELVLKYDLYEGAEITEQKIVKILHSSEKIKIMNRAFKILRFRQRSVQELRNRLLRIGYDVLLVDAVISDLIADNTLDDERFATAFVKDYTTLKPKGNRFIISELTKKGIAQDIITRLLKNRDEKRLINEYIAKKVRNLNIHNQKERQKLLARLMNRGFTPGLVYDSLNELAQPNR